jgi:hypothetical protein
VNLHAGVGIEEVSKQNKAAQNKATSLLKKMKLYASIMEKTKFLINSEK